MRLCMQSCMQSCCMKGGPRCAPARGAPQYRRTPTLHSTARSVLRLGTNPYSDLTSILQRRRSGGHRCADPSADRHHCSALHAPLSIVAFHVLHIWLQRQQHKRCTEAPPPQAAEAPRPSSMPSPHQITNVSSLASATRDTHTHPSLP